MSSHYRRSGLRKIGTTLIKCFSSGMISGPGLALLSRFPIVETFIYRYPVNGRPSAFYRGDWYVGKSAAVTVLEPPSGPHIALINSHMHAPYALTGDAAYACHRAAQAWDLAGVARRLERQGYAVVLVGDLNSRPGSLPYRILSNEGQLHDSWELLHGPSDPLEVAKMSPQDQVDLAATTCDSTINTWRAQRAPTEACRLDYALIGGAKLTPVDAGVVFTERIPDVGSYSDHFAYTATFEMEDKPEAIKEVARKRRPTTTESTIDATTYETSTLLTVYDDARALILEYLDTTSRHQKTYRFYHFVVSIILFVIFIPVIIVVSYQAPWASVIFFIVGCVVTVTGVIDGLISFLFGRNEQRALREILMQIGDRERYEKSVAN
ncbi:DEKNAAC103742 [Brettanomyces naardenensis]|uniref:DEKNAAC103743 n=1 Tax=Brettanomyces naardenensis TaxID=13370 RepID=A0A448YP19_BRENA|nr:DEKNAAC103742 [Brettanomyces naardenensis]